MHGDAGVFPEGVLRYAGALSILSAWLIALRGEWFPCVSPRRLGAALRRGPHPLVGLAQDASMSAWLRGYEPLLWCLGALSVVMCVGTLVAVPLVVARLPADYFTHAHPPAPAPGIHRLVRLGKNGLGIVIVLVGVAMLVLPGQGILTILIGLMLLDFPGKRRLERRLVQQPAVWRALNWMRAKAHQPAFEIPSGETATPGHRPAPW